VDIRANETMAPWMLACKRPGGGIEPREFDRVVGMQARRNISSDSMISWTDLTPEVSSERCEQDPKRSTTKNPDSLSTIQASKSHA
jgi:hypothetical protein